MKLMLLKRISKKFDLNFLIEIHKEYVNMKNNKKLFFENLDSTRWLTTEQAASYLSLTPNALRIWVHRGKIIPARLGRRLRFCRKSIDKALNQTKFEKEIS